MALAAAERVPELLSDVLGGRAPDPDILAGFVQQKVPESLNLEYKRGTWLKTNGAEDIRAHVSAFANADGGIFILGIAGDDVPDPDRWTFEPPICPDKAGWTAWLGRVLGDVKAKTRVEWRVVDVSGKEVVVIATNRAAELIRVPKGKRDLACWLRIADNTVPIDESLFVDLALGRRARPDLTLEDLKVDAAMAPRFHINTSIVVHNQGLLWVPAVSVAWVGYDQTGTKASASLIRELDVQPTSRRGFFPVVGSFNVWRSTADSKEVRPFEQAKFGTQINLTTVPGPWMWCGAIVAVPQNGLPLWAQAAVQGENTVSLQARGWVLPKGASPMIAWFEGNEVYRNHDAIFGDDDAA